MTNKVVAPVRFYNVIDAPDVLAGKKEPIELECKIDTGAMRTVIPLWLAQRLNLVPIGKRRVTYADARSEERELVAGLCLAIMGRDTTCNAIVEPNRRDPLVGMIQLEDMLLNVDSQAGKLVPCPGSEHGPVYELD